MSSTFIERSLVDISNSLSEVNSLLKTGSQIVTTYEVGNKQLVLVERVSNGGEVTKTGSNHNE